jgi:hypothetical protein
MKRRTAHRTANRGGVKALAPHPGATDMEPPAKPVSPFLSIWFRPRATIRRIVDTDPTRHVLLLAIANGMVWVAVGALMLDLAKVWHLVAIVALCVALGAALGIAMLYFDGWLIRWTGHLLGGKATAEQVRAATAWSMFPSIFGMILNMPIAVVSWQERGLAPEAGRYAQRPDITLTAYPILVAGVRLWIEIIYYKCYGEVHGFSAWRAWGASMLEGLVIGIPLACVVVALVLASGG